MNHKILFITVFLFTAINNKAQDLKSSKNINNMSTASKNVSTFVIDAPQLHSTKKILVYLPENYNSLSRKYDVIYMQDGQNLFDSATSYAGEWNVDEKLDFIVKTLKPHIDKTYNTKAEKKNTTIMGSSLGGLTSYYAALKYSEVFGKDAVFSPSFWINQEIYNLTKKSSKIKTKIYFLCGDDESEDMVSDLNKMELLLNKNRRVSLNLNKKKIVKGGKHNEKLWRDGFVNAVVWLGY